VSRKVTNLALRHGVLVFMRHRMLNNIIAIG
jgi:hypothetical protein